MSDIRAIAAQYVGVPFKDKGRDPTGWDCWGLLRFVGGEIGMGRFPSFVDAYVTANGDVSAAIEAHLGNWRRLERPRAGAALLHVTRDVTGGTTIERFDTIVCARQLDGAYLPKGKEETCNPL